jgi:RNA polymerase sigma factor (sigma-70 family)
VQVIEEWKTTNALIERAMPADPLNRLIPQLRQTLLRGEEAGLTDGKLLERFVSSRDQAALEGLIRRYGPMVWGVCQRILPNHHDTEDAFQATFLVLVRKAGSIRPKEMVGNWLYGVARQTALKAKATTARRRAREKQVTEMPEPAVTEKQDLWHDLQPLLDQELSRLPDRYRAVLVLCDLGAKTRKEVAQQLGVPEGTVASRLMRARTMLAKRLARHGLPVEGGALAVVLSQQAAPASVPTSVVSSTIKAASLLAAGNAAVISGEVAALTEGVLTAMFLNKLKSVTVALVLILSGIGSGVLIVAAVAAEQKPQQPAGDAQEKAEGDSPEKGVLQTTPAAILTAYNENDASADEKFTGKQLEITGKLGGIRRVLFDTGHSRPGGFGGPRSVYMLSLVRPFGSVPLWFQFDIKDQKQLAALKPGQQDVTIRGLCNGRSAIVADGKPEQVFLFIKCEIVSAKPAKRLGEAPARRE